MSLKQKIEAAFVDTLRNTSELDTAVVKFYTGQENQRTPRGLPCVTVDASGSREEPLNTGNFKYRVLVGVWGSADQALEDDPLPEELHAENVRACQRALNIPQRDLAALLSTGAGDFHCFGVVRQGQVPHEPDRRAFVDFFSYEVTVCEVTFV